MTRKRKHGLERRDHFGPSLRRGERDLPQVHHRQVEAEGADLIFTGPAPAIAGAVYGGVSIEALEAEGALKVEGDRNLAATFVTLFPLPPKAGG